MGHQKICRFFLSTCSQNLANSLLLMIATTVVTYITELRGKKNPLVVTYVQVFTYKIDSLNESETQFMTSFSHSIIDFHVCQNQG